MKKKKKNNEQLASGKSASNKIFNSSPLSLMSICLPVRLFSFYLSVRPPVCLCDSRSLLSGIRAAKGRVAFSTCSLKLALAPQKLVAPLGSTHLAAQLQRSQQHCDTAALDLTLIAIDSGFWR